MIDRKSSGRTSDAAFWRQIFTLEGSVTPYVLRRVLVFGGIALGVYLLNEMIPWHLGVDIGPYEVAGAVLGLLLVFRTNAGYDRWYEGRKLLGSITNDSRSLAITALTVGPDDPAWRETVIGWIASFGHVCRVTLRRQGVPPEVHRLVGPQGAEELGRAESMPAFVALRIGQLFRQACDDGRIDRVNFLEGDQERARLVDHFGGCERIAKTPIPWAYAVNIRRFIFLYLTAAPFALLDRVGWLSPIVTMLIAYPILSLDQLGVELQNPFATKNLNHLPFDDITARIERDLLGMLSASRNVAMPAAPRPLG